MIVKIKKVTTTHIEKSFEKKARCDDSERTLLIFNSNSCSTVGHDRKSTKCLMTGWTKGDSE